jgi:hypothetical protein
LIGAEDGKKIIGINVLPHMIDSWLLSGSVDPNDRNSSIRAIVESVLNGDYTVERRSRLLF